MTILSLSNLTRRFGDHTALNGVDLTLTQGERIALLGHNGAGKSTLMKIALGPLPASAGEVRVADPRMADDLLECVGLGEAARRRIGTYSKGMRQRVGLAQAMIGTPRLMILDEPTSGLDPVSRRDFYALLDEAAARGTTILLSSHALSEVEARIDRIVILSKGQKVADGTLDPLRSDAALPLAVEVHPRPGAEASLLAAFPQARRRAGRLVLTCPQAEKIATLRRLADAAHLIADFVILPSGLDDIYATISQRAA